MKHLKIFLPFSVLLGLIVTAHAFDRNNYVKIKSAVLRDPFTRDVYHVQSLDLKSPIPGPLPQSQLIVTRYQTDELTGKPHQRGEIVQTVHYKDGLVDFDLDCQESPPHCYLVTVSGRSNSILELFSWQRTQFVRKAERDIFSQPHSVKVFRIHSAFYVAVAQDQLHLNWTDTVSHNEKAPPFIGCTVFKFLQEHDKDLRYHQLIRLDYHPRHVGHFISIQPKNFSTGIGKGEMHFLVFSNKSLSDATDLYGSSVFSWSSVDENFWPYRLLRSVTIERPPDIRYPVLNFPPILDFNITLVPLPDQIGSVELCFNQLQRLLADRNMISRKLIDSSRSLWIAQPTDADSYGPMNKPTSISAPLIVTGNVIVHGLLIETPRMTIIGNEQSVNSDYLTQVAISNSPQIIDATLQEAKFKLRNIRDKLARAILTNSFLDNVYTSRVRFWAPVRAKQVIFSNGLANSNVRLNGIPFHQLEHELFHLEGHQEFNAKVTFEGDVVADFLEIHGTINGAYQLKHALDITSRRVQVIESTDLSGQPGRAAIVFDSVSTPELILSHNATFNNIRLDDFITADNKTQTVFGMKSFEALTTGRLVLADRNALLNKFDMASLLQNSVRRRHPRGFQVMQGSIHDFHGPIVADRLMVNNLIDYTMNVSSLIHDSVKTFDIGPQIIFGPKTFIGGLSISHLSSDGSLNDIKIDQIFNLNPEPPVSDFVRHAGAASRQVPSRRAPLTGHFSFLKPIDIRGNLNVGKINDIDLSLAAVKRQNADIHSANFSQPQVVAGVKRFLRPLHIMNRIRMLDQQQIASLSNTSRQYLYPFVNGIDVKGVSAGLKQLMQNPSPINIDNLMIDGNLNLESGRNQSNQPSFFLGPYPNCPLDLIRRKLILTGDEEQQIEVPIRIESLRSRISFFEPRSLNDLTPDRDFVFKSGRNGEHIEQVFGHKHFDQLIFTPSVPIERWSPADLTSSAPTITLGSGSSINTISYKELRTFIEHERLTNFTGESTYHTINVYGNIRASTINGQRWPEDILLKSTSSSPDIVNPPFHNRIYSPIIFLNTSSLTVFDHLSLRGPIKLDGFMNGVNLTEFARSSVTYGDKDLLSMGRPMRNKIFAGGIIVNNEIRSQGRIDGVSTDELFRRVLRINRAPGAMFVNSPKIFMSDAHFLGPMNIQFLYDLPFSHFLNRIKIQPDNQLQIFGKKIITGTLKIDQDLIVYGLVNKIDFVDLKANSISLSSPNNEININQTLVVEGDVFMDNLLIDERNGTIDGVKLTNLLPIDSTYKNELIINEPILETSNQTYEFDTKLSGYINDCQITCTLTQKPDYRARPLPGAVVPLSRIRQPMQELNNPLNYPARQIQYHGKNVSIMRTTPPYATDYNGFKVKREINHGFGETIQRLMARPPVAITFESHKPVGDYIVDEEAPIVRAQLDILRKHIASLSLIQTTSYSQLIVGFIDSATNDLSSLILPDIEPQSDHAVPHQSFLTLDYIDFPFNRATTYHLIVGVPTGPHDSNDTTVYFTVGDGRPRTLSSLPIESPNSALFLPVADMKSLFLLISQDDSFYAIRQGAQQCPTYQSSAMHSSKYFHLKDIDGVGGAVHVYLFHALQNSSSLTSAYFDLYQTIDLPNIDSFESFHYDYSTYAIAVSRSTNLLYLMILRGYSGFQIVSQFNVPLIERVKVLYTPQFRPVLVIYQTNGYHRLMESVII